MKRRRKCLRERKIFMQFFMTTLWLPVFDIPFIVLGYIENPSHWLGFFTTVAYTINCSINGWVYLVVNRTVQYQVKKMIFSPKSYLRNSTKDETPSNTDDFTEDSRGTIPLKNSSHACVRDKYSGYNAAADSGQLSTLLMISSEEQMMGDGVGNRLKAFA